MTLKDKKQKCSNGIQQKLKKKKENKRKRQLTNKLLIAPFSCDFVNIVYF